MRELSLHVLDVIENAVEAGASRIKVTIDENLETDAMVIEVLDDGRGMSQELAQRVLDPFYTTRKTRHINLNLPLFAKTCRRCEGDLTIQSELGKGTRIRATFRHSHIDRAPLGNMPTTLLTILLSERAVDLNYTHRVNSQEFQFDSSVIRKELGNIPLTHPKVRNWLSEVLCEGEESLSPGPTERQLTL